jgi:hypothetical protein
MTYVHISSTDKRNLMAKKQRSEWKTKECSTDPKSKMMICMNSDLSKSKWAEYYEGESPCDVWVKVDMDSTAVLCSKCTQMTLK